jgi:RHS repeat-associated protein
MVPRSRARYTFDANGNRSVQSGSTAITYSTASTSNHLTSTSGALARTYSYDASGNTLGFTGETFSFNQRGRMSSATTTAGTTNYTYNARGELIEKNGVGGTTLFVYDEVGHLLGEYSSTGALIQETVWMDDIPVATLRPNGSTVTIYYVHTDHLNAPRIVTQASDNSARWVWGGGAPNQNPLGLGTFIYNLRFPGQYSQAETGLAYNYFRDYDPQMGRYVESDPIGLSAGVNTYAYAADNPVSNFDPRGLAIWKVTDTFQAGAVAGIGGKFAIYTLESPCSSSGTAYTIKVYAVGPSAGLGVECKFCFTAPVKIPVGEEFDDHSAQPDPNAFNGPYLNVGAGFHLFGFGKESSDTVLGHATDLRFKGFTFGFGTIGAEVAGTIGTSTVIDVKTKSCCH